MRPHFPEICLELDLSGDQGSTPYILTKVMGLMRKHKISPESIKGFRSEIAAAQDYNAVLAIVGRWIDFNHGIFLPNGRWIR